MVGVGHMVSPRPRGSLHMAAPAVPCLPESSWVQPPWGPLQSVPSTGDTPSIVTEVRDSGCSGVQAGATPPPWLPPPGCAIGKLRHRTGQGGEAIAGGPWWQPLLLCRCGAGSGSARAQRCHLSSLVSEGWRARGDEAAP